MNRRLRRKRRIQRQIIKRAGRPEPTNVELRAALRALALPLLPHLQTKPDEGHRLRKVPS